MLAPKTPATVAGVPPALRTAHMAARELAPAKIIFAGRNREFASRWSRQIASLDVPAFGPEGAPLRSLLAPADPLLIVSAEGFPAEGALGRFAAAAADSWQPLKGLFGSQTVAVYYPEASAALKGGSADETAEEALEGGAGAYGTLSCGWRPADSPDSIRAAERALYAGLPQPSDGYLAAFDRRISIALSSLLVKTPVTPDAITTAGLVLSLLGAWGLAAGSYAGQVSGALLLWFCCILDGCDGEVARLKLLCSPSGAAYDLAADHAAHLATFAAVPIGAQRLNPASPVLLPGLLLVSGVAACALSVWWLVLRKPEGERGRYSRVIERVASRDYVYLILACAALGRLDWFLWAAAFGSHAFNASLWILSGRT